MSSYPRNPYRPWFSSHKRIHKRFEKFALSVSSLGIKKLRFRSYEEGQSGFFRISRSWGNFLSHAIFFAKMKFKKSGDFSEPEDRVSRSIKSKV